MTELELDSLLQRVMDLGTKVEYITIKSEIHSNQCDSRLDEVKSKVDNTSRSDVREEILLLNDQIDINSDRITSLENANFEGLIEGLSDMLNESEQVLRELEVDHLTKLGNISEGISNVSDQLVKVGGIFDDIIEHLVISLEDYLALGTPDEDVLYFTYE